MSEWKRPELCRLCQCPVGGEGVPVSRLDKAKLSCWWLKVLRTDWDDDDQVEKFFCQFCLWDAKFLANEADNSDCDWWRGHTGNKVFFQHYYLQRVIRPCSVFISPLLTTLRNESQSAIIQRKKAIPTDCIHCGEKFKSRNAAYLHTNAVHEEHKNIRCRQCLLHFRTFKERAEHYKLHPKMSKCHFCYSRCAPDSVKQHITDRHAGRTKCCEKRFENIDELVRHISSKSLKPKHNCIYCKKVVCRHFHKHVQKHHGSVAISCHYLACRKYFLTHEEKHKHVAEMHENKANMVECIYCKCKVARNGVPKHMFQWHKSISIGCDFNSRCPTYFHTEAEKLQHLVEVHLVTNVAPKVKCIYCGHVSFKKDLHVHVRSHHTDIEVFRCDIRGCFVYFLSDSDRQSHFLVQHAAREAKRIWQCGQCSHGTFDKNDLERHIEVRHGTKKLKCPQCQKIYKSQITLRTHVRVKHSKEKFCMHCKSFTKLTYAHLCVRPCRYCQTVKPCVGLRKAHEEICRRENRN